MTGAHRDLTGAALHPPKAVVFTGDPAAYVPPAAGILVVCDTAPNAGKLYRTTGTTAGALSLLATGQNGAAATVSVGTVTTVAPGQPAVVGNSGTSAAAVLNFDIPAGAAATVSVGTVTAPAGVVITVANGGTSAAAVLNFGFSGLASTTADVGTLTYAATVTLDMAALTGKFRTISLTGDLTLAASNQAAGRGVTLRLVADAAIRNLVFPAGWVFMGTKPTALAAGKTAMLKLLFFGATDADCVATFEVQS